MSRILHNPFLLYLGTCMNISPLRLIFTSCGLNTAVHIASQIFPIDTNELRVRLGIMWLSHASSGKTGKSSKHGLLYCMVWTFGHLTQMGGFVFVDGKCGASAFK